MAAPVAFAAEAASVSPAMLAMEAAATPVGAWSLETAWVSAGTSCCAAGEVDSDAPPAATAFVAGDKPSTSATDNATLTAFDANIPFQLMICFSFSFLFPSNRLHDVLL